MEKLKWDTSFWGIDFIHIDRFKDLDFSKIKSESFIIQAISNVGDISFINSLESEGFKFVDSRITMQKKRCSEHPIENANFSELNLENIIGYQNIFYELFGQNSRYSMFTKEKINEFYYTWIVNSINGLMDDKCIGYFIEGKLAGFVTYRIRNNVLTIGLFGIVPRFQGKGISQVLLNYIDYIVIKHNISSVKVATQGKNLRALNSYIKNGYSIYSIDHWYYLIKGVNFNDSI